MSILQGVVFITFDINTKETEFIRNDNITDYDTNTTNIYVQSKYKKSDGETVYLSADEITNYNFSLFTIKPLTNKVNEINGAITNELIEQVRGGVVKFVIPKSCTNRSGIVKCELHINKEKEMIASTRFILDVQQSLVTKFNDSLLDDKDFPVLQQLILDIQKTNNINDNIVSKTTTFSSYEINSLLNDKVDKGNVSLKDINKNNFKLDQTYLSEELLQQIAGTAAINTTVADRSVTTEKIAVDAVTAEETNFLRLIRTNYVDESRLTQGYVKSDGTITLPTTETNVYTSDFIEVNEGATYATNMTWQSGYYDKDKTFVSLITLNNISDTKKYFTVPTGVKYVRVAGLVTTDKKPMMNDGEYILDYVSYDEVTLSIKDESLKKYICDMIKSILLPLSANNTSFFDEKCLNLFDTTNTVISDGYINSTDGTVISNTKAKVTDFIEVSEGEYYIGNAAWDGATYDAQKNFVESRKFNSLYQVPAGVKYIRASTGIDNYNNKIVYLIKTNEDGYVPDGIMEVKLRFKNDKYASDIVDNIINIINNKLSVTSELSGLKWNCLGDSITYGECAANAQYHKIIGDKNNMTVRNYGISGTRITNGDNAMYLRYADMDNDADIITVFGGTNDYSNQVPLGTINDTTADTFYGALNILCEGLIKKYLGKKIGFITPIHRYTSGDITGKTHPITEYVDAIKNVCAKWSIPCLDLYSNGGFTPEVAEFKVAYTGSESPGDGLHPNAKGHALLAPKIESWLKSM